MKRSIFLVIYYIIGAYLPSSYAPVIGKLSNAFRIFCVKRIFKYCGKVLQSIEKYILAMEEILRLEIIVELEKIVLFLIILLSENM